MAVRLQIRRDTEANWSSANPVLSSGELAWESDTNKMKIGDGSTAYNSLAYFTQGPTGPTGPTGPSGDAVLGINNQTGTTYTLALSDSGKIVVLDNVSGITLTVPTNGSIPFPTGSRITLTQKGAGQVTVAGASGVTVNSANGLKLNTQYSIATLIKLDTDVWYLTGDTEV